MTVLPSGLPDFFHNWELEIVSYFRINKSEILLQSCYCRCWLWRRQYVLLYPLITCWISLVVAWIRLPIKYAVKWLLWLFKWAAVWNRGSPISSSLCPALRYGSSVLGYLSVLGGQGELQVSEYISAEGLKEQCFKECSWNFFPHSFVLPWLVTGRAEGIFSIRWKNIFSILWQLQPIWSHC